MEEYVTDKIKDIVTFWICWVSEREDMQNIELFSKLSVPMFQTLFLHSRFYFPLEKFLSNMSNAKVVRGILVRAGDSEFGLYQ